MQSYSKEYLEELMVQVAYHSVAEEGRDIPFEAVKQILTGKEIVYTMTTREFFEIENYRHAFGLLLQELAKETKFSITFIKELHYKLMDRIVPDAGQFKGRNPSATDTKAKEAAYRVIDWCKRIKSKLKSCRCEKQKLEIIHQSHVDFESILPFREGNRRVARMLMIFLCLAENLHPPIEKSHDT